MKADRIVWDAMAVGNGRRCVLAFSAAGNSTEVRAVRAALNVNRKIEFTLAYRAGYGQTSVTLVNDEAGYDTQARGLGLRHYHLVAVARRPGFLPAATPQALWDYLRKETTTPIDRRWLDALSRRLLADGRMTRPASSGVADAAIVVVDDEYMDGVVKSLLSERIISITNAKG